MPLPSRPTYKLLTTTRSNAHKPPMTAGSKAIRAMQPPLPPLIQPKKVVNVVLLPTSRIPAHLQSLLLPTIPSAGRALQHHTIIQLSSITSFKRSPFTRPNSSCSHNHTNGGDCHNWDMTFYGMSFFLLSNTFYCPVFIDTYSYTLSLTMHSAIGITSKRTIPPPS